MAIAIKLAEIITSIIYKITRPGKPFYCFELFGIIEPKMIIPGPEFTGLFWSNCGSDAISEYIKF